ncbi:MAG: PfkB family carbohydrate kinase [Patescibacteria group bacterium]|nr:PfkB family carbohydrate kinase [Patescibacteria group bacterium]
MKPPEIVVVGFVQHQEVHTPVAKFCYTGGAAYAAACALRTYGVSVGLVTRIGDDLTEKVLDEFPEEGISRIAGGKTARMVLCYADTRFRTHPTGSLVPGVASQLHPGDIPEAWVKHATAFHIATMPPVMQEDWVSTIRKYRPDALISVDTGLSFLRHASGMHTFLNLAARCSLVFLNRYEYAMLAEYESNLPELIVKLDRDGAELHRQGRILCKVPAPEITPVDVTNAGDVLAGAYLAGILQGTPAPEALRAACITATRFTGKSAPERFDLL